ncbi:MAG: MMPL family transporter, partial [Gaiellales bacterium]
VQDGGANQKAITDTVNALKKVKHVYSAMSPFENAAAGLVSKDGHYAFIPVVLDVSSGTLSTATAQSVYDVGVKDGRAAGMKVDVGGPVGSTLGVQSTESSEVIGLVAAMIILLFTFTTLVAMGLPILTAVLGLLVGSTLIGLMGHLASIPSIGPTLATMIGLGVGIDYALFLITKHRTLMREHGLHARESIPEMLATSGGAVLFAGCTVVVALLALAVAQIPFITSLGYACAVGVLTAVLAGLTLLPAILAVLGDAINRGQLPFAGRPKKDPAKLGIWGHWANSVVDHPIRSCVIALVLLALMIVPVFTLVLGQEDIGTTSRKTTERQAFDMISDGFGPGYNGPLVVAVTLDPVAKASSEYTKQYNQATAMQADLEEQQKTLTAQASALQAQQTKLEQQANALQQQAATLEAQSKKLAKQAASVRKAEAGLRFQEGQLTREARRLAARRTVLDAQIASLAAHQSTLATKHASLQADLAKIAGALANTPGISATVQDALLTAQARLTDADATVQQGIAAASSQAARIQKRSTWLSKQEQNYVRRAAKVTAKADLVAAEAAAIERQSASLHAQAASLQKQQAILQRQADALQQQADELKQQQAAAEAEQQQALDLKDQLTAEMTKAGGDERGTDPRIVKLQDALAKPADVQRVVQPLINDKGNAVILSVIAKSRPAARATANLVHQLRDETIPPALSLG